MDIKLIVSIDKPKVKCVFKLFQVCSHLFSNIIITSSLLTFMNESLDKAIM